VDKINGANVCKIWKKEVRTKQSFVLCKEKDKFKIFMSASQQFIRENQ